VIYIDVTAACLLPLQSGIPRTTRGVYRLVEKDATPIFWQPFRGCYTGLSSRSRSLLQGDRLASPDRRPPRDSTLPLLRAAFRDLFSFSKSIPLDRLLTANDTLLLTSLFPDNRLGHLRRLLAAPGYKVAIFHDAIPLRDPRVAGWEKVRHIEALRLLARLNLVIAVSQSAREDLELLWQKYRIVAAKTAVVPWPVPFPETRPAFSPPTVEPAKLLYVSRLKLTKNHATLFAACEKLWRGGLHFQLDLIGCEDEPRESRRIVREIDRLRREGRPVSWRAQVSERELHRAYAGSSFTVFPSTMEGFGLPIVESLWHGRPVICSDRGAVGELAQQGGCLIVDVKNPDALADAIRELLQNETHQLELAQQAYARPVRIWNDYAREFLPLLHRA
jgi:glycosyltransferase involved in cell wall biosynthesis